MADQLDAVENVARALLSKGRKNMAKKKATKKPARKARKKTKVGAKAMLAMGRYAATVNTRKPTKRQTAAGKNIVSSRRGPVLGSKFGRSRVVTRKSGITVAAKG